MISILIKNNRDYYFFHNCPALLSSSMLGVLYLGCQQLLLGCELLLLSGSQILQLIQRNVQTRS